ncbi:carboxypeptidase-like regulatory domain-containing protein [Kordia sp.]|uniref:carboxypeptidase-like regulatory domain-containing protein n=1 Tax=Kordia sp. TaxID=1965332 RepID=UPI0025BFF97B|nr:carboxypeptidase-like regulatory domain-containing protein [Kordia sp.]MCH2195218.1 carboxypeptidase-like regulatory domain-containing protein [Kordia sp.]
MKKITCFILTFLFTITAFAQYEITIDAHVLDMDTKAPIPYVNVEFQGKDLKAVTDAEGKFTLTFDEGWIDDTDRFQLVANGYNIVNVDMSKLSKYLTFTDKIFLTKTTTKAKNTLKGTVFTEKNNSIQNAIVQVKNSFKMTQTKADGSFEIAVNIGDVLVIDYVGVHKKEIVIRDMNPLNIKLQSNTELLNEVTLKGKKSPKKKQYTDTGFGRMNLEAFGGGSVITSDNIGPQHIYVSDVLRGSIAGLFVYNGEANIRSRFNQFARRSINPANGGASMSPRQPVLILRGNPVQVYYDGFPYYGNIDEIEIRSIDNIVVLKSMASTILYGGIPTILITSKNRFLKRDVDGNTVNSALLTNNYYKENIPLISNSEEKPIYIAELEQAKNYAQALEIYKQQKQNPSRETIPYYLNTAEYFKRWNDEKPLAILKEVEVLAEENPKALKSLAYKLEELGEFAAAKIIYQRIALLLPNSSQSYRDLALAYKRAGNYQESLDLYIKMLTDSFENIDFSGIENPLLSEMQQLLRRHRVELDYKDIPSNLLKATFKYDVRIVLEWNRADAEFELQFVNPTKKFYTWQHSIMSKKDRLLDEAKNGYYMEEFIIDEADMVGEWMVNVKSLETEKAINPTYLKYTIYRNYGTPNQERSIKIVKLYKHQQKVTLDKIKYQPQQSTVSSQR